MFELKLLDEDEVRALYAARMVHDFPADELKPLSMIVACMRGGAARAFGLYEDGALAAYAVALIGKPNEAGILDYLAVAPERRGQGVGGEMLRRLRAADLGCAGLIVEYECPVTDEQTRREAFYLKNGVRKTAIDLILYGVYYHIGYLPCPRDFPDADLKRMQTAVYNRIGSTKYRFLDEV